MFLLLAVLLIALILGGLGFAIHILWWIALIVLAIWLLGFLFRTAEGSKFAELTVNNHVVFEVDDYTAVDAWSVVLKGHATPLVSSDEIMAADALPLRPWVPTLKRNYVRIVPNELTGRSFERTPEPDHTDPSEPA